MECDNAPLLGSAILAAVGAGWFDLEENEIIDVKKEKLTENGEKIETEMLIKSEKEKEEEKVGEKNNNNNQILNDNTNINYHHQNSNTLTNLKNTQIPFKEILQGRVKRGVAKMVRIKRNLIPDPLKTVKYRKLFSIYEKATESVRSVMHDLVEEEGKVTDLGLDSMIADLGLESSHAIPSLYPKSSPSSSSSSPSSSPSPSPSSLSSSTSSPFSSSSPSSSSSSHSLSPSPSSPSPLSSSSSPSSPAHNTILLHDGREALVVPSLLAADFACLGDEANNCLQAGNN